MNRLVRYRRAVRMARLVRFARIAGPIAASWLAAALAAAAIAVPEARAASLDPLPGDVALARYLEAVEQTSNDLAAQREAVTSARAGIAIAGLRPDPTLSLGAGPVEFSREVDPKPRLARSVGLSYTVETGGKRDRRLDVARSQLRASEVALDGVRRQASGDAAAAFIESCRSREALQRQEASLRSLSEIVRVNEQRHRAGDLGGLELLQSRNERDQFLATVVKARADAAAAMEGLSVPLGRRWREVFGDQLPLCAFHDEPPPRDVDTLVTQALDARDDVLGARAALDAARAAADLTRANRYVDPNISLSYGYTPRGRIGEAADGSPTAPSPRSNTLSLSLSVPIPVSRLARGDLVQAESAVTQAMLGLRQTELKAQADVRVTFMQVHAAFDNLARYRDATLVDAERVLAGMRTSYQHGAASLLELLSAQRAADDTYLAYLQARSDLAGATVRLQLSVGRAPAP
ncbi:TolC family protein [Mitsuaria sp. GD03876]|uniref:TolC family protein n=1 Tax=Mitsuaria sp. GD03876 TaxID=2975399 RepID=UPI002448EE9E|nr:TolC family protein [Mitsuaria sp. GD03876]MDH0864059.1 TolC family protein [Mitsuaria sp. GD03876]